MFERWMKYLDWVAIPIGLAALLCNILLPNDGVEKVFSCALCALAAILGGIYVVYAVILWCRKPQFDWHLINGNFLRKVCCLVLLTPSMLVSVAALHNRTQKELVFDDNLYTTTKCKQDTIAGVLFYDKDSLHAELPVTLHKQVEEKLPDSIAKAQEDPSLYWSVYYHFIDPGNQHMTTTKGGRNWAALTGILGVFLLNGLLVSSIIGYIDSRKEKWQKGEVRYKCFLKRFPHYVIIGGNDMVSGIVKQKLSDKRPILIQTSCDVEVFRRELFSTLNDDEQKRVIIYYGSRTSEIEIKELYIENAIEVYILGEETRTDDLESYHDTMNMECLGLICDYMNGQKSVSSKTDRLVCRVMFEYQTTFSVFQFYDIDKKVQEIIDFRPFNYYEMWAQKMLINKEIDTYKLKEVALKGGYLPLEGTEGIKKEDDNYVHLFIVGMSRMGVAMAIEAAHLAHYPNFEEKMIRTKITFIDKNAAEEKDFFMGRFKELFTLSHWKYGTIDNGNLKWISSHQPADLDYLGGDFLDIEWEFINGGVEQNAVQDYILASTNPLARVTIAICLPESNRSHAAALYLDKKIYAADSVLQVLVYNRHGDSIITSIHSEELKHPYLNKLKPFGAPKECFDEKFLKQSEDVGDAIDSRYAEIYELYIKPAKEKAEQIDTKVNYKGKSQVAGFWSNIYNGNTTWSKLRSIGYKGSVLFPEQINILADVEHNRWNIEQLLMNFRPLTQEEQIDVINRMKDKEVLKGEMAHLNICSNKRLIEIKDIDVAARAYDEGLTTLLPDIYSQLKKNS